MKNKTELLLLKFLCAISIILIKIELKNNRYFIKSPIIESPDGNDNTALLLNRR